MHRATRKKDKFLRHNA